MRDPFVCKICSSRKYPYLPHIRDFLKDPPSSSENSNLASHFPLNFWPSSLHPHPLEFIFPSVVVVVIVGVGEGGGHSKLRIWNYTTCNYIVLQKDDFTWNGKKIWHTWRILSLISRQVGRRGITKQTTFEVHKRWHLQMPNEVNKNRLATYRYLMHPSCFPQILKMLSRM